MSSGLSFESDAVQAMLDAKTSKSACGIAVREQAVAVVRMEIN